MSVDEPSIQESAESDQPAVRVVSDADGVKLEPSDVLTERQRNADDDKRILGELPPHWGVFSERER